MRPSAHDLKCYHYLFDSSGKRYDGVFRPEDNLNCSDGQYAAHTGGANTGSIGVCACGMTNLKANDAALNPSKGVENWVNPLTRVQIEAMCKWCAQLCKRWKINVSPQSVFTHAEFGLANPKTSSHGKIDISYLPFMPELTAFCTSDKAKIKICGDWLRNKILWYYQRL